MKEENQEKRKKKSLKEWWQTHKPTKRRLIQVYAALLVNANIKGFVNGSIYKGNSKNFCIPGLNCYSCPGAVGACPLGALQNALASSGTRAPFYMFGILILFGLLLGRTICGFLCPVGLGQELLYKIKTPKLKKNRFTRLFSYLKYVILAVFALAIPIIYSLSRATVPGFCKYICPAGTFGGALSLLLHPNNADYFTQLGPIFTWKFCVMVAIIVASIFIFRFFCRFLCPLGAIYGFFNKISFLGVKLDENKCTDCGLCVSHCKMDVKHVGDHECINCGECISVCPAKAIRWKGSKLFVHKNAVLAEGTEMGEKPLGAMLKPEKSEFKEEIAVSDTNNLVPQEPQNEQPPQKPKKKRDFKFWLQVGAWALALVVLAGSLIYYNVLETEKNPSTNGGDPIIPPIDDNPPIGGEEDIPYGTTAGTRCKNFAVETYVGKLSPEKDTFVLSEHLGEIVIVNFWATWCGPCVAELPDFNRIASEYDVTVVAIHSTEITTNPANTEGVQKWIDTMKDKYDNSVLWTEYPIIFAQDAGSSYNFNLLGGKDTYPMTLVIDQKGVIYYTRQGSMHYDSDIDESTGEKVPGLKDLVTELGAQAK